MWVNGSPTSMVVAPERYTIDGDNRGLFIKQFTKVFIDICMITGYTILIKRYNPMANIKTAVSIQESIFEQVETIAHEMKVSRSRLFGLALEIFIRDYQDRRLFEAINQACAEVSDDPLEQSRLRQIRRQHRRMVEGEW